MNRFHSPMWHWIIAEYYLHMRRRFSALMTAQWPSFPFGLPTGGRDTCRHERRLLCDITLALLGSTWWVSVAHQTTLQAAPTCLLFLLLFPLLLFLPVILCNRWHSWRLVHSKDTVENKTKKLHIFRGKEKNYYLRGLLTQVPVLLSSWEVAQERSRWHGELGEQKGAREGGKGSRQCWNRLRFRWAFTSSKWKWAFVWAVFLWWAWYCSLNFIIKTWEIWSQ